MSSIALFVPHLGCPHRCSFCDQRTISGTAAYPTVRQIDEAVERSFSCSAEKTAQCEIAFFGGSFTALPPEQIRYYLTAAQRHVDAGTVRGIRCSTRPDAITDEILDLLCRYTVTTVELGAQSMNDRVLQENGRGHTAADVTAAAEKIRQRGIALGLQMMTGLPGDHDGGARDTARSLADLCPDCVRIYPTLVLAGTELHERFLKHEYQPQTLPEAVRLCSELLCFFDACGIPVIRLGLHDSDGIRDRLIAGPYHPAFRELCESRIYLSAAQTAIAEGSIAPGKVLLTVAKGCESKMAGQHRSNLAVLQNEGYYCSVGSAEALKKYEVRVKQEAGHVFEIH